MKGDHLPSADYVVRHCEKKFFYDDGISAGNFLLRKDALNRPLEEYLSVGWLERYSGTDRDAKVSSLRQVMHPNIRRFHKKDKLGVLNVGRTVEKVKSGTAGERSVRVLHEPSREDEAHSGIYDTVFDEIRIAELLVEAVEEVLPARHS